MTRFDPGYTANFYDRYGSRESTRWENSPRNKMQHALFRHYLRERVQAGDRVLDAGSGPGVYAKDLLEIGARVTCLDLSNVQLQACRERTPGCDAYELGSVTDLSRFSDSSFDVTLALGGVLSYCFERAPEALSEMVRVTRPGGWIGLSVMNLFGTIHGFLPGVLAVALDDNRQIVANGNLDRKVNDGHECHMFRVDEIRGLLVSCGLNDLEFYANGWLIPNTGVQISESDSELWEFLFETELKASRESPGAGTHIIAFGRAPDH